MSYSLDIYYGKLRPTKDFISFASFVSFFPQLVAGPIERASNLLPQILRNRSFKYEKGIQGVRLMLWGMFKKVVIADSLGPKVDYCFNNYQSLDGGILLLGLIYFSFQIYCDFSGYSDIAIGTSMLFGFELMSNFKFPYFSRNIIEFWRRWHISLSSWFKDYLYIPLGGSKKGRLISIRNIFTIFIISGFWHGANWTFIIWGLIHALLYLLLFLQGKNVNHTKTIVGIDSFLPSFKELIHIVTTYFSTLFAWTFFRSESINQGFLYLVQLFQNFGMPSKNRSGIIFVIIIIILDWMIRRNDKKITFFGQKGDWSGLIETMIYAVLLLSIFSFIGEKNEFLYFQF